MMSFGFAIWTSQFAYFQLSNRRITCLLHVEELNLRFVTVIFQMKDTFFLFIYQR